MKSPVRNRALFMCLALVAGFSVLSVRLVYLQWIDREEAVKDAAVSLTHTQVVPARFGLIVDRNEEIVARNLPVTKIVADMRHLEALPLAVRGVAYAAASRKAEWSGATDEERAMMLGRERRRLLELYTGREDVIQRAYLDHVVETLGPALRMHGKELRGVLTQEGRNDIPVAKNLREDEADEIEGVLREARIQGFRFEKKMRRWYPASKLATHTVGYRDHEGRGRCGVERSMSEYLRGRDGYRVYRTDNRGLLLAHGGEKLSPPRLGLNVQLTLDFGIQAIVEEELDAALGKYISDRGAVIVMAPETGDLLAIASRPHFDLNVREGVREAAAHYAIQAIYEPGSTFKMVAAAGALDAGLVTPETEVNCYWGYRSMGAYGVPDHHPYGMLTVEQVLQKSSNTGAFELALRLGRHRFVEYLKAFGFTEKTGLGLAGEEAGMLADPSNAVNFSRMSYGYGVAVTPLQVACAYAALGNGGVRMTPRLVKAVVANDGTVVERYEPRVVKRVVSETTARRMLAALAMVVDPKGTAKRAKVPGFRAAGKTGTSEKLREGGGGYCADRFVVSFAGLLPAEKPAFVCVVVIDDPRTEEVKRYGGTIAAPVFARIAERTAAYLNLVPTEPVEEEELLAAEARQP